MLIFSATLAWATLLTAQAPTFDQPDRYRPTADEAAAITDEFKRLATETLKDRQPPLSPERFLDFAVVLKAVDWAKRHNDYFAKRDADAALALLKAANQTIADDPDPTATVDPSGWQAHGYQSRVDGSIQPYLVYVPESYRADETKGYRLDVVLHGRNQKLSEVNFLYNLRRDSSAEKQTGGLTLHVFGRTNNAYRWAGETDVFEAIAATKARYRVDESQIVLRGFSMGGAGAWHLGLHHPSLWRSVEAGAGFSETKNYARLKSIDPLRQKLLRIYDAEDYALNAFNVPIVGYGGEDDPQLQASENIVKAIKDLGFPLETDGLLTRSDDIGFLRVIGAKMGHKVDPPSAKIMREFHDDQLAVKPDSPPERVRFVTWTLKYPQAGGIRIEALGEHYQRAEFDASTHDETCKIKTQNIQAIAISNRQGRAIQLDDQSFPAENESTRWFRRDGQTWKASSSAELQGESRKRPGLQGPIDDAFTGSFLCVRGTGKPWSPDAQKWADARLETFATEWDRFLRGRVRIKNDVDVTEEDIRDHHLVLFGDPGSNALIARMSDRLPVQWSERNIGFHSANDAQTHAPVLIAPNPLNPHRYAVINSGHTFGAKEFQGTNALLYPRLGDFAVIRLHDGELVESGLFDESWSLPSSSRP